MALGIYGFLAPNKIATGGTAGIAILLNYMYALGIGTWMLIINIPLILIGIKFLGKTFAFKTILCIVAISASLTLLNKLHYFDAFSETIMLATLYGGLLIGIGLGLVFKGGASAGGASIIAQVINKTIGIKQAHVMLAVDALVIIATGIVFKSIELALWSLISIYATSKIMDTILIGTSSQKIVHISSRKNLSELSNLINTELGISGTILKGQDLQVSEYKDVIMLMSDRSNLNALKKLVINYDSEVKMIVMEATEVLGK